MSSATTRPDVVVIGAGIIGIAIALRLQMAGMQVRLLDRDPPARGASFGNAGALATSEVIPLAEPGIWKKLPGWMLDPLGPLTIRWRHLPTLSGWLLRFAWASRSQAVGRYAGQLSTLLASVNADFDQLASSAGVHHLWRRHGALALYRDAASQHGAAAHWQQRKALGVASESLSTADVARLEPLLQPDWRHAVSIPDWSHVDDPYALAMELFAHFCRCGGEFSQLAASRILHTSTGVNGVALQDGSTVPCRKVVLAAGVWSKPLAADSGQPLHLASERGYHLTLPHAGKPLRKFLLNVPDSFVVLPMANGGIRLAGTVELASIDAAPDYRRAYLLLEKAESMLGRIDTRGMSAWMGGRPSVPHTVPVIGPVNSVPGLYLATGHGHLGLTLAATTARLLHDELVLGREIPAYLHPPGKAMRQSPKTTMQTRS